MRLSDTLWSVRKPAKGADGRTPLQRKDQFQLRLPVKAVHTDRGFEYESPRSPEFNEDVSVLTRANTDLPRTKANPLPGTLAKDFKNPLTQPSTHRLGSTSFILSQPLTHTLKDLNSDLKSKVHKLQDEIKKWRRLRLLTLEKEKLMEQLQLSISLAEQEKAELLASLHSPELSVGLPVGREWRPVRDPWTSLKPDLERLREKMKTFLAV